MRNLPVYLLLWLPLLLARPAAAQGTAPALPDSAARLITASCKWVQIAWRAGSGSHHLVVLAENPTGTVAPQQGQPYLASPFFLAGQSTQNGGFVCYADTGRTATLRGLQKGHSYQVLVYGYYAGGPGGATYQLSRVPDTLRFTTPACPNVRPARPASRLRCTTIDCSTFQLTCHPGSGQQRLFVLRKSSRATAGTSAGDVGVTDEDYYPAANLYARGFPINPGLYALYAGSDSSVVVYGLAPDQIYKCAVYEYNTVPGPDGQPDGVTPFYSQVGYPIFWPATGGCTGSEPAKSWVDDQQHQTSNARVVPGTLAPTSVQLTWHPSMTPGHVDPLSGQWVPPGRAATDGVGNYVVIRNSLAPNALSLPLQNTVPAAVSSVYGQGAGVRPGMDSIYSVKLTQQWSDTTLTISGLRPGTPYTADVFTFRYPDAAGGSTTPYTYFLSAPQASVSFFTPATPPGGPLPVQLVRFEAARHGEQVELRWATASEQTNLGFRVERSGDGVRWAARDFIAGAGTSTQPHAYRYAETYAPAAYYRLAQLDPGRQTTYGPVRYVAGYQGVDALGLYPNPARLETTLSGTDPGQPVDVYDLRGRLVLHVPAPASALSLQTVPPGLYLVRQGTRAARLLVQ